MKVADILAAKDPRIITIKSSDTIGSLCERLRDERIGAAVVVSSDGQTIEGVITERDVTYGLAIHKSDMYALPVLALMTKTVITCSPTDKVSLVASTMLARNIRHIPVLDDKRLVGMISIRDVLKWRVKELQEEAGGLRAFASLTERNEPIDR